MKKKSILFNAVCLVFLLSLSLTQNTKAQNLTANNLTVQNGSYQWLVTTSGNDGVFYIAPKSGSTVSWNISTYIKRNGDLISQKAIGIKTTNTSGYALAVNGNVRAKEIRVNTNWSDFVFDKEYALPSLSQVEAHILQHKHLPDIPSAAEVEAEGVELGKISSKLLQKIEELTLYVIEQDKRIQALETEKEFQK